LVAPFQISLNRFWKFKFHLNLRATVASIGSLCHSTTGRLLCCSCHMCQSTLEPHPSFPFYKNRCPLPCSIFGHDESSSRCQFCRSTSSPSTGRSVAPHSPPSSPSSVRSSHGAPRAHYIHRAAPRDKFRAFPASGCVSLTGSPSNPLLR
jgi:hypothetical protein